jgi:hypothetical protein
VISTKILKESGYEEALLGMSLSYNAPIERMPQRAENLAHGRPGENKFLESIMIWLDVTAPRYWWQTADTYRLSTKQSGSTSHTILKRPLVQADFSGGIPLEWVQTLNHLIELKDLDSVKRLLPESFLQRRIWVFSYKTAQNIYQQRNAHKILEWREFCDALVDQLQHPEFLREIDEDLKEAT